METPQFKRPVRQSQSIGRSKRGPAVPSIAAKRSRSNYPTGVCSGVQSAPCFPLRFSPGRGRANGRRFATVTRTPNPHANELGWTAPGWLIFPVIRNVRQRAKQVLSMNSVSLNRLAIE